MLNDSTTTIRASIGEVQRTLLITGLLVLLTIVLFLRRVAATLAAAVTVPLSIAGTFAGMWAMGFSLNNYSLMAIVISVGFVVDDAIVMIENITRLREQGMAPLQAAILGSRQIGFTVISISLSLVAVFIPLLFMGGILGTVFHEFAFTLTFAIAISAVISLTLTPMVCGRFIDKPPTGWLRRVDGAMEHWLRRLIARYGRTADWGLDRPWLMVGLTIGTVVLTFWLYGAVPKGFLSEQDTGLLRGTTIAAPGVSFEAMSRLQKAAVNVVLADPAVATVSSNIGVNVGFDTQNRGTIEVALKPLSQAGWRARRHRQVASETRCHRRPAHRHVCRGRIFAAAAGRAGRNTSSMCWTAISTNCAPGPPGWKPGYRIWRGLYRRELGPGPRRAAGQGGDRPGGGGTAAGFHYRHRQCIG